MNNPMHNLAVVMTEKFISACPLAAAQALEALATHEILLLVSTLKARQLVACMNPMNKAKCAAVLRRLPLKQAAYVLTHLDLPQAAGVWKEFSAPYQERMKKELTPAFVALLNKLESYPKQSVGRLMERSFVAVRTETKVGACIDQLKNLPRKKLPPVLFVTGKNGELKGVMYSAELAFYAKEAVCGSVMTPCIALNVTDLTTVARTQADKSEADVLPVVNEQHILVGVVQRAKLAQAKIPFWKRWKK